MPKTPLELAKLLFHIPRRPFLQYAPVYWNTAHHMVTFLKNTLKSLNKDMTKIIEHLVGTWVGWKDR